MNTKHQLINAFRSCDLDCSTWDKSALEELAIVALTALLDPTDKELLVPGEPYRVEAAVLVPKNEGIKRRRDAWNKIVKFIAEESV